MSDDREDHEFESTRSENDVESEEKPPVQESPPTDEERIVDRRSPEVVPAMEKKEEPLFLNEEEPEFLIPAAEPEPEDESTIDLPPYKDKAAERAKRKRRLMFWLRFSGYTLTLFAVVVIIGGIGAFFYCKPRYDLAHSFDLYDLEEIEVASRILDRDGGELGRIFVQNRRPVPLSQVSPNFTNALLAAEDSRFFEHSGVDYYGILRAAYYGIRSSSLSQGASTVTQQLARQTFELKDRTLSRKITEVFLAQRIEKALDSKEKILELYINRIYFGSGYYGIASAAEGYFGKEPDQLTPLEGATLAAAIPNPYHRSPRNFPETSKRWRNHVLGRMRAEDHISKDQMERFREETTVLVPKTNITGKSAFVYEEVREQVIDLLGYETVSKGGFEIHTTIDGKVQEVAEETLKEQLSIIEQHPDFDHTTLAEYKEKKSAFQKSAHPDQSFPAPKYLQGALLMIDNKTGAIIARVGGRDFSDSMFDRVTMGRRPTGTAFKPFVYAAAFENGLFPGTLVDDVPMDTRQVMVGGTTGILGEWGPENFENVYENVITARRALALSKNAATVRIGQKVGTSAVVKLAQDAGMGFRGDLQKFNATFLGRNPASPEELCLAYTIFPNNGRRPDKVNIIENIKDSDGNIIYTPSIGMASKQAIDRYTAYQVNSILQDSFDFGTAKKAREKYGLESFPVAGKTGTEYNFTDNWFVGYSSEVTCVVWAGFDQKSTIFPGAFSSDTVLPVWTKVMNVAAESFEPRAFLPPPDAEQVEICLESGELASDSCYEVIDKGDGITSQVRCTYTEYLRPGTSLEKVCHIHGKAGSRLSKATKPTRNKDGILRVNLVVQEDAEPILPIAPTIIGTDDPYNSVVPVLRARVAPIAAVIAEPVDGEEDVEEEEAVARDGNGIPVARPVIVETEDEALPDQRVALPRPRAIEFD